MTLKQLEVKICKLMNIGWLVDNELFELNLKGQNWVFINIILINNINTLVKMNHTV